MQTRSRITIAWTVILGALVLFNVAQFLRRARVHQQRERNAAALQQAASNLYKARTSLDTRLRVAARDGDIAEFKEALAGMPEESRASSAVSAMSEAASTGRSAVIQWWFASGQEAKLKPQRPTASILLECAGQYGYPQLMEYLLAHGASVNEFEGKGATPLHGCASWIGSSALVSAQCLIKHGAHINARVAGYPIADTIRLRLPGRSQPDAVTGQQTLEETEADFGGPIRSGYTPLMLAAENGNYKMMALLRRYHANERLKSPYGETASAIAARVLLHDIDEALFYPPPPPFRGGFATF